MLAAGVEPEPCWSHNQPMSADGTHQVLECSVATVGKVSADVVVETRGRSWVYVVHKPKQAASKPILTDVPPRDQAATIGIFGALLESHSEDVLRTLVCSTEKIVMP